MKLLFLDIDGVLNGHDFCPVAESNSICRKCVEQFNRIILTTGCKVVLSSAWRYMVTGSAMTLPGFTYMLRTHGVTCKLEIIGTTATDEVVPDRTSQILRFVSDQFITGSMAAAKLDAAKWVVLDDMHLGLAEHRHVRTNEKVGLTEADADRVIELLGAK